MTRRYHHCPDCGRRMRRSRPNRKEAAALNGKRVYDKSYECPQCSKKWIYSEKKNVYYRGTIEVK